MWNCPVCSHTNIGNICSLCNFDRSTDYVQYPTLQKSIPQTATVSHLRNLYAAQNMVNICRCCGSIVTGDNCTYCGFILGNISSEFSPETLHLRAANHTEELLASLTDFSIVAYRYAWEPARSRLELQAEETISLGNAQDLYKNIIWANQEFGQLRNGTGTELHLNLTYHYRGKKKRLSCTIPTVKSDRFWLFGISLDASIHLRLYLGSGKKFIETAPIALDLT